MPELRADAQHRDLDRDGDGAVQRRVADLEVLSPEHFASDGGRARRQPALQNKTPGGS